MKELLKTSINSFINEDINSTNKPSAHGDFWVGKFTSEVLFSLLDLGLYCIYIYSVLVLLNWVVFMSVYLFHLSFFINLFIIYPLFV